MPTEISGVKVGDKLIRQGMPWEGVTVEVIGFRYHTSRNTGITYMVADYIGCDKGEMFTSFDDAKRVVAWPKAPPPLALFYIAAGDEEDNQDLFVSATDSQSAIKSWREYYETEAEPNYIWRVPSLPSAAGAIGWDAVKLEGGTRLQQRKGAANGS